MKTVTDWRSEIIMTLGKKIRKYRMLRGMTQKELGLAFGFSEATADSRIRKYESGTMKFPVLLQGNAQSRSWKEIGTSLQIFVLKKGGKKSIVKLSSFPAFYVCNSKGTT